MTKATKFQSIVDEINLRAKTHSIGGFAELRAQLKGRTRLPRDIFPQSTVFDTYAFHYGGRKELQFNIGLDNGELRHGVAFSLETNQTLPKIDVLIPKIGRFNNFMELYAEKYADMQIWYYDGDSSSGYFMPAPIPAEWVQEGVFIFLGRRQKVTEVNYDLLLDDLDRLLPLYRHVEGKGDAPSVFQTGPFKFIPGFKRKASTATVTRTQKDLDMMLRHNILQEKLYQKLAKKHGKNNVSVEQASGVGTSIDLVVRHGDGFWFYEIKTADSPRACLRQAVGQLLEYAFWPGAHPASRLVVVGENAPDAKSTKYLETLKRQFRLPIAYEHLALQ